MGRAAGRTRVSFASCWGLGCLVRVSVPRHVALAKRPRRWLTSIKPSIVILNLEFEVHGSWPPTFHWKGGGAESKTRLVSPRGAAAHCAMMGQRSSAEEHRTADSGDRPAMPSISPSQSIEIDGGRSQRSCGSLHTAIGLPPIDGVAPSIKP